MPRVQLPKYGTYVDFPDSMSAAQMQAAVESDVIPHLQKRQQLPVDPNDPKFMPKDVSGSGFTDDRPWQDRLPEAAATVGHTLKGVAQGAGSLLQMNPVSMTASAVQDVLPAAKEFLRTGSPTQAAAAYDKAHAPDTSTPEVAAHSTISQLPVVGSVASKIATPAIAYTAGNRPVTADDRLQAAEGVGEAAGMTLAPEMVRGASDGVRNAATRQIKKSGAIETSVIDPTGQNPELATKLAQQRLQSGNARMTNPPKELAAEAQQRIDAARNNDIPGRDLEAEALRDQIAPNSLAPEGSGERTAGLAKGATQVALSAPLDLVKGTVVNPALALFKANKLATTVGEVMSSPGWKTASADLRYKFGKALGGQDFETAAQVGAQIAPDIIPPPDTGTDATLDTRGLPTPFDRAAAAESIQRQQDIARGDYNATTGDANPIPARKPAPRNVQPPVLESAGQQISKGQVPTQMPGKGPYAAQSFVNEDAGTAADTTARDQNIEFGKQFGPQLRSTQMQSGNYGKWAPEYRSAYEAAQRQNDFGSMIRIENEANKAIGSSHAIQGIGEQSLLSEADAVKAQTGEAQAYYVGPDGQVTPLDFNESDTTVPTAAPNPRIDPAALIERNRQKNLAATNESERLRIERDRQFPVAASGVQSTTATTTTNGNSDIGARKYNEDDDPYRPDQSEFAHLLDDGTLVHENTRLLRNTPIDKLLPARFANARKAVAVAFKDSTDDDPHGTYGRYLGPTPEQVRRGHIDIPYNTLPPSQTDPNPRLADSLDNTVTTYGEDANNPFVILHEFGHAAYERDLTRAEQQAWNQIQQRYDAVLQRDKARKIDEDAIPVPGAIKRYSGGNGWHSFPSLFASYILDPTALRAKYPDIYTFMKQVSGGREYTTHK